MGTETFVVELGLSEALTVAARVNDQSPPVRFSYRDGRASYSCDTDARTLQDRVVQAQAEVHGEPRPAPARSA